MKFSFEKLSNSFASGWNKLGIFTSLAGGILIIAGTVSVALAYVPTKFLAVPVASAGTLVGTFICALAFLKLSNQAQQSEIDKGVEAKLKLEKLVQENQAQQKEIENLQERLTNKNGMGSFAKYTPELRLTFLQANYDTTKFYSRTISEVAGEESNILNAKPFDTNPELAKYLAVYNRKGQVDYEVDLRKLKAVIENGELVICGKIPVVAKPIESTEKEFLLSIIHHQEWDFDKTAKTKDFRGELVRSEFLSSEENLPAGFENQLRREIENEFTETLRKIDSERERQFEAVAQKYLDVIAKAWNLRLVFAPERTSNKTFEELFYEAQNNRVPTITDF